MLRERLGPSSVERFRKFVAEIRESPAIEDRNKGNDER
jgi:hypothetical protein